MKKLINILRKFNARNEDHVLALYEAYDRLFPNKRNDDSDPLEGMTDKQLSSTAQRYATMLERIGTIVKVSPIAEAAKTLKRDQKVLRAQLRRMGWTSTSYQAKTAKQIIRIVEQGIKQN